MTPIAQPATLPRSDSATTTPPLVSVLIVTFNSAARLPACLQSLAEQTHQPRELLIVDNASGDSTPELLRNLGDRAQVIFNSGNRGFAAAQNQAIRATRGQWLLCLNPDVILSPGFIHELLAASALDAGVGTVCGKLLRWQPAPSRLQEADPAVAPSTSGAHDERSRIIDSAGIYFLPNLRHLDRGAEELDQGQYQRMEYVFGATGAAALYRRDMVEDVSINGEFFDEEFFSYREDADLAWRAQLMGWKCLYVPAAVAWHERRVTPERRHQLPHEINWHSVKNRFLMRAKNIGFGLWWRLFFPAAGRDGLVAGYALLRNWKLVSAVNYWIVHPRGWWRKRKIIQRQRRVSDRELARWFRWQPASEPGRSQAAQTRD